MYLPLNIYTYHRRSVFDTNIPKRTNTVRKRDWKTATTAAAKKLNNNIYICTCIMIRIVSAEPVNTHAHTRPKRWGVRIRVDLRTRRHRLWSVDFSNSYSVDKAQMKQAAARSWSWWWCESIKIRWNDCFFSMWNETEPNMDGERDYLYLNVITNVSMCVLANWYW